MEFNSEKWRGEVFWTTYSKMENHKFSVPEFADDEFTDDQSLLVWIDFGKLFKYALKNFFYKRKNHEPVFLLLRLIYWIFRSNYRTDKRNEYDEKPFDVIYIEKSKVFALSLLLVNIFYLFVTLCFLEGFIISLPSDDSFLSFRHAAFFYTMKWLFCSVLCVVGLAPFVCIPGDARKVHIFGFSCVHLWLSIGQIILAVRFLHTLTSFFQGYLEGNKCYGLRDLHSYDEYGFRYIFYQSVQDLTQVCVLCGSPFSWPWPLILASIAFLDALLRTATCGQILDVPDRFRVPILLGYVLFICLFLFLLVTIVSMNFQRSIRTSGSNAEEQKQIAQETKDIVHLLCTDVKVLLRQGLRALGELMQHASQTVSLQDNSANVTSATESILTEVDNLLFLAKVGEGRFDFSKDKKVEVMQTILAAVRELRSKIQLMNSDIQIDVMGIPTLALATDKRCLHLFTFYSLLAVYYFHAQYEREQLHLEQPQTKGKLHVNLQFQLNTEEESVEFLSNGYDYELNGQKRKKANSLVVQVTFVNHQFLDDTDNEPPEDSRKMAAENETFQSICVVCNTLAEVCNGRFEVHRAHIQFALPVVTSSSDTIASGRSHHSFNSVDIDESQQSADNFVNIMRTHVCAYVTDALLEGLFLDVLEKIPGSLQMTIHHVLNPVDLKIRAIVVVQSVKAYHEIHNTSFAGKIVLFTERMSYLDKDERSKFDFILPLPPSQQDLNQFINFVRDAVTENLAVNSHSHLNAIKRHSSRGYTIDEIGEEDEEYNESKHVRYKHLSRIDLKMTMNSFQYIADHFFYIPLRQWKNSTYRFFYEEGNGFIIPNLCSKTEDYAKWRFVNPAGDLYHHSTNVEFFGVSIIFFHGIYYSFGLLHPVHFSGAVVQFLLQLYRGLAYRLFPKMSKSTFWYFHGFVSTISGIFGFTLLWINEYVNNDKATRYDSFYQYVEEEHRNLVFSPLQKMFYIFISPLSTIYFGIFLPWPVAIFCTVFMFIRCLYFLLVEYQDFVNDQYLALILLVYCSLIVLQVGTVIYMEIILRREFFQLYQLTMSRAYFDSCLQLVRQIDSSLQHLLVGQQVTLQTMKEIATTGEQIVVKNAISSRILSEIAVKSVHQLQKNVFLGQQLRLDMAMIDEKSFFGAYKTDVIDRMRATMIVDIVQKVCELFLSECQSLNIQMTVRIVPEAMIIRVDTKVLTSLICNVLRRAIQRIEEAKQKAKHLRVLAKLQADSSNGNHSKMNNDYRKKSLLNDDIVQHHILLYITPPTASSSSSANEKRVYRFTDIRPLRIFIFDSASFEDERHGNNGIAVDQRRREIRSNLVYNHRAASSSKNDRLFFASVPQLRKSTRETSSSQDCRRNASTKISPMDDFEIESSSSPLLDGIQLERRRYLRLPIADKHIQYFQLLSEKSSLKSGPDTSKNPLLLRCEEGTIRYHAQFRAYQSVYMPYLLSSNAELYLQLFKYPKFNQILRIHSLATLFYPHYAKHPSNSSSADLYSASLFGNVSRMDAVWDMPPPSSNSFLMYNSTKYHSSSLSGHSDRQANSTSGINSTTNSSGISGSGAHQSGGNGLNVAFFMSPQGIFRRHHHELHWLFTQGKAEHKCRIHELSSFSLSVFTMPDIWQYTGEEIVVIEFSPFKNEVNQNDYDFKRAQSKGTTKHNHKTSTHNSNVSNTPSCTWQEAVYDRNMDTIRLLVHFLRMHGFPGLIVIVGPALVDAPLLSPSSLLTGHEKSNSHKNGNGNNDDINRSNLAKLVSEKDISKPPSLHTRDAMVADVYVNLPLTEHKFEYMMQLKHQRLVELVLAAPTNSKNST